jgi:malate dehydrogenase (oxaloacetate-decarboxylating)
MDVMNHARPSILLGVSGQPNQFSEALVKAMAQNHPRPIIFPLSNPTSRAEADPRDILRWTQGKALVATGSPFDPASINGQIIPIAQCNNSYIFPGVGLGVVACGAKRVTNAMMMAAAMALSELAPATQKGEGPLLPKLSSIREVSKHIASAVITEAIREGKAEPMTADHIKKAIEKTMWTPAY